MIKPHDACPFLCMLQSTLTNGRTRPGALNTDGAFYISVLGNQYLSCHLYDLIMGVEQTKANKYLTSDSDPGSSSNQRGCARHEP